MVGDCNLVYYIFATASQSPPTVSLTASASVLPLMCGASHHSSLPYESPSTFSLYYSFSHRFLQVCSIWYFIESTARQSVIAFVPYFLFSDAVAISFHCKWNDLFLEQVFAIDSLNCLRFATVVTKMTHYHLLCTLKLTVSIKLGKCKLIWSEHLIVYIMSLRSRTCKVALFDNFDECWNEVYIKFVIVSKKTILL